MLAGVGCLLESEGRFAFNHEKIEILPHDEVDRVMQGPHNPHLEVRGEAKDAEDSILEDGIAVENE